MPRRWMTRFGVEQCEGARFGVKQFGVKQFGVEQFEGARFWVAQRFQRCD
jgi:hypothetical protein